MFKLRVKQNNQPPSGLTLQWSNFVEGESEMITLDQGNDEQTQQRIKDGAGRNSICM